MQYMYLIKIQLVHYTEEVKVTLGINMYPKTS